MDKFGIQIEIGIIIIWYNKIKSPLLISIEKTLLF